MNPKKHQEVNRNRREKRSIDGVNRKEDSGKIHGSEKRQKLNRNKQEEQNTKGLHSKGSRKIQESQVNKTRQTLLDAPICTTYPNMAADTPLNCFIPQFPG